MPRIVCGLLNAPDDCGRARDLTVSWLRWGYFGDILEDSNVDAILQRAEQAGYEYCFVQGSGHIVTEHASPNGGKSRSFFEALPEWIAGNSFCMAGLADRCLLVDLAAWRNLGRPSAATLPVTNFAPELSAHLIDLEPDLSAAGPFLQSLDDLCAKATRGVFVLNYESYSDVEETPPGFRSPLSALYCVAAGLKPNRILETHGFDERTRMVFFDYSSQALAFRRLLHEEWDGRDYPRFLRTVFSRMPASGTHYYLWPGASVDDMDWPEMERLWVDEVARWGGPPALADHWSRYRELRQEYVLLNILTEQHKLLDEIEDRAGSAIWWSNAFCTIYSATHYGLEQKRQSYEQWARGLAQRAPGIFLYGSDHSNSSVNGIAAGEYWEGYQAQGGDPLLARQFHRRQIRF
jgi:hypothetical protein